MIAVSTVAGPTAPREAVIRPRPSAPPPHARRLPGGAPDDWPSKIEFDAVRAACRASGGIATGDDLARLLEDHRCGDFVSLARHIVCGDIFGFEWQGTFWVPMFQFDLRDLSFKESPRRVRAELSEGFDGWALADWFAQPNTWLGDRPPVDLLDTHLAAVLEAARADRFIVAG